MKVLQEKNTSENAGERSLVLMVEISVSSVGLTRAVMRNLQHW